MTSSTTTVLVTGGSGFIACHVVAQLLAAGVMEMVALNPVAVLGPAVSPRLSGGNALLNRILTGDLRRFPDLWLPIVDVRDVAAAHLLAMTTPAAAGQRFIVAGQSGMTLAAMAQLLRDNLGEAASRVGSGRLSNLVVRAAALVNPSLRWIAADLGHEKRIDGSKLCKVLSWTPRPADETVLDTARSLLSVADRR